MSGLLVRNACVAYGRREVLRGVSLPPLLPGSVTALIGPNGAGKSTLLRGIAGLQSMQGAVLLDGVDLACGPQARRAQSMVYLPQSLPSRTRLGVGRKPGLCGTGRGVRFQRPPMMRTVWGA